MTQATTVAFENPLLELASLALADAQFSIERLRVASELPEVLFAENEYFVLCVVPASSAADLVRIESLATRAIINRVSRLPVGAKRWDLYLVLISPDAQPADENMWQLVREIEQNTQGLRRVVRLGVQPTLDSVEASLRAFLPITLAAGPSLASDALADLAHELPKHGIPEAEAGRLVDSYRATGRLHAG